MPEDGDGDGGGDGWGKRHRPTSRCLGAARYTVAAAVTVLIVVVTVIAVKVVLRPESLRLSVSGGCVYSTPQPAKKKLTLALNLRAENPSGRARMYLLDIAAYLFDNATLAWSTPAPDEDCVIFFNPDDEAVLQQMAVDSMSNVEAAADDPGSMDPAYFDRLYDEAGVLADATLRVEGRLVTEVRSGINRTRLVTYFCWPLLVGAKLQGGQAANKQSSSSGNGDVPCTEKNLPSQA